MKLINRIILGLLLVPVFCFSQDLNFKEIDKMFKNGDAKLTNQYYFGRGESETFDQAKEDALSHLANSISVDVRSFFQQIVTEENLEFKSFSTSTVETYSNVGDLKEVKYVSKEKKKGYTVYVFMNKADRNVIFEERKNTILAYTKDAIRAQKESRIGPALMYYYWAYALLHSHPEVSTLEFPFNDKPNELLKVRLYAEIQEILTDIKINIKDVQFSKEDKTKTYRFEFFYNDQHIESLDYSYRVARGEQSSSVRDGTGYAELFGESVEKQDLKFLNIEYMYKYKNNREVLRVLENYTPYFSESRIRLKREPRSIQKKELKHITRDEADSSPDIKDQKITPIINAVLLATAKKEYNDVKNYFTDIGFGDYDRLLRYGNAKCLDGLEKFSMKKLNDEVVLRSFPTQFNFKNNNRKFIENVNFTVNSDNKITKLSFALNKRTIDDILSKPETFATVEEKWSIIHFIEDYQTAYALNNLEYLKRVFSDNALIIVGRVFKRDPKSQDMKTLFSDKEIQEIKFSKKEYLKRLNSIFKANEYVNIDFESCIVTRKNEKNKVFGVQIQQNYYSTNYADKGYLFLLFDLKDIENPIIKVRAWQAEKGIDGSVYGVEDFYF